MFYIGIDPGHKGGIAILNTEMCMVFPYSDVALKEVCELYQGMCVATVESVHAMPGQGVTSMFTFGKHFGYIIGVLDAFQIPHKEVIPQTWKKFFGLKKDKEQSIKLCKKLYPDVNLLPTSRSKKESDGMGEAILIARYGKDNLWDIPKD